MKRFAVVLCVIVGCSKPQPSEPVFVPLQPQSPVAETYESGYQRGYRAWMEQNGIETKTESYAVLAPAESPSADPDESVRGYIDGYHRASESMVCPAHR